MPAQCVLRPPKPPPPASSGATDASLSRTHHSHGLPPATVKLRFWHRPTFFHGELDIVGQLFSYSFKWCPYFLVKLVEFLGAFLRTSEPFWLIFSQTTTLHDPENLLYASSSSIWGIYWVYSVKVMESSLVLQYRLLVCFTRWSQEGSRKVLSSKLWTKYTYI